MTRAWERFWFSTTPASTLALVRIAFGVVVLAWGLSLGPDLAILFGPERLKLQRVSAQENLSPQDVARMRQEGGIELVDVREPYEHEAGRIAGDRHIPLAQVSAAADSIPRDRPVVFYCRVGSRSDMAAQAFRASGWDARNMEGGLVAWAQAGLPLEPEGGTVAEH